jgi:hypothetical protein
MSMTNVEWQLEAVKREQQRQDQAWAQAADALRRAGDVLISVPGDLIEPEHAPADTASNAPVVLGIRV